MKKLVSILFLVGACATIPKTEQVSIRASHDLQCDRSQIKTTQIDAKTVKVEACGKEATYEETCPSTMTTRCNWVARKEGEMSAKK
jgi:hypothetical protein